MRPTDLKPRKDCDPGWVSAAIFARVDRWAGSYQRNNKGGGLKNLRCFPHCKDVHVERGFCGGPVYVRLALGPNFSAAAQPPLFAIALFRPVDEDIPNVNSQASVKQQSSCLAEVLRSTSNIDRSLSRASVSTESDPDPELEVETVIEHESEQIKRNLLSTSVGSAIPRVILDSLLARLHPTSAGSENQGRKFFVADVEAKSRVPNDMRGNQSDDALDELFLVFNQQARGWHYGWHGTKHTSKSVHCLTVLVFAEFGQELRCVTKADSPNFSIYSRKKSRRRSSQRRASTIPETQHDRPHKVPRPATAVAAASHGPRHVAAPDSAAESLSAAIASTFPFQDMHQQQETAEVPSQEHATGSAFPTNPWVLQAMLNNRLNLNILNFNNNTNLEALLVQRLMYENALRLMQTDLQFPLNMFNHNTLFPALPMQGTSLGSLPQNVNMNNNTLFNSILSNALLFQQESGNMPQEGQAEGIPSRQESKLQSLDLLGPSEGSSSHSSENTTERSERN